MSKIGGGKYTKAHTTYIDAAVETLKILEKMPAVTKISLGMIRQVGTSRSGKRLKVNQLKTCLLLTIKGNSTVQEIRVYGDNLEKIKSELES